MSDFPEELSMGLQKLLQGVPRQILAAAASDLSKRYRSPTREQFLAFMSSEAHRLAYMAVRMPATFAVVRRVLMENRNRMPQFFPASVGDIGAGPGTATWAAKEVFPMLSKATLHEKDSSWLNVGKQLMLQSSSVMLQSAEWRQTDLAQSSHLGNHDLMVLSYVIGELPMDSVKMLVEKSWKATSQVLVIIEPGTPHGFERIRVARQQLIDLGAYLVAPCPHHRACPMPPGDWCHFSERLERSNIHMAVKEVEVGYEDEKYSYVVAARSPVKLPEARVLRHPGRHSGHVELFLCGQNGLEKKVVSRKQGEVYKKAKKLDWGDTLE